MVTSASLTSKVLSASNSPSPVDDKLIGKQFVLDIFALILNSGFCKVIGSFNGCDNSLFNGVAGVFS